MLLAVHRDAVGRGDRCTAAARFSSRSGAQDLAFLKVGGSPAAAGSSPAPRLCLHQAAGACAAPAGLLNVAN